MLKDAYDTNKKKNTELVDSIKSGLKDLKSQQNVLINTKKLYEKRQVIISAFADENICLGI